MPLLLSQGKNVEACASGWPRFGFKGENTEILDPQVISDFVSYRILAVPHVMYTKTLPLAIQIICQVHADTPFSKNTGGI